MIQWMAARTERDERT